jgi:protein O-GlcNAc transferase
LTSPLGQPALVAKGLERALRMMWERWCAELPAQSLDVAGQGV